MTQDRSESIPEEVPKSQRDIARELDIINTQLVGQAEEGGRAAEAEVEDHIMDAEELLEQLENEGKDGSKPFEGDIEKVMRNLNTAIAIMNDPYARELKKRLMMRFPQSERKDK